MTSAYTRALRYLGFKSRTIWEVEEYLKKKGHFPEEIDEAISRLLRVELLDDRKVARTWLEGRLATRPLGQKMAAWELKKRGVAPDIIYELIASLLTKEDELSAAQFMYNKCRVPPERDKFLRLLYSRGFSQDIITKIRNQFFGS